ncbi:MAG: AAA domain-containing protein, partial [Candidatus Moraniibacteriota bacterium]
MVKKDYSKISQIKFDKGFIKRLLDKLKVGNARSIHLNAIPGRSATRLDLCQLESADDNIPEEFIEIILNKESFSFVISYDKIDLGKIDEDEKRKLALITKRLNSLVIENTDNFLEFGLKSFGFGYPLLIKRDQNDPSKIIKAPLFIWNLDIERSYRNKNCWTIKKEEDSPIKINELLISHLSKDESIQLGKISSDVLEDGILDKEELLTLVSDILSQLNVQIDNLDLRIEKCPDAKQIENIANSKPWIQWSGIFGVYRSQNETIIHSTEELLDRFDEFESENLVLEQFQTSTMSAVETDPSKEEIVNTLTKDEIKLIQGPPGTGKSQSITAIISNALVNGATCLIVCEKKTALDVIQANLEKIGLDNFAIVVDDVNKDRKKIIEKARNIKDSSREIPFPSLDFKTKYKKFCEIKKEINSKYAESLKKVFGDYSWKQLIGFYFRYSKSGELEKITSELSCDGLNFSYEEYSKYLATVEEAMFLYADLGDESEDAFSILKDSLFVSEYKWAKHELVKKETNKLYEILKSEGLFLSEINQCDCEINSVSLFKLESIEKCEFNVDATIKKIEEIVVLYDEGIRLAGKDFDGVGFWQNCKLYFSGLANIEIKRACAIKREIRSLFKNLCSTILEIEGCGFTEIESKIFQEFSSLHNLKEYIFETLENVKKIESKISKIKDINSHFKYIDAGIVNAINSNVFSFEVRGYIDLGDFKKVSVYYSELKDKIKKVHEHLD